MTVSVIMAVFNAGNGDALRQAVASIQRQALSSWELIICDDGSTDDTWSHLQRLAADDTRIKLLRNEVNRKAGFARNRCIEAAKGAYIAVMDSDDYSHPYRLLQQVEYLNTHVEFAFVGTKGIYFNENNLMDSYWFCRFPQKHDFLFTLPFVHASIMFRRGALEQIKGYSESKQVLRNEDYDLLMRMYAVGLQGANLSRALYFIRKDNSLYRRRKYRYRFIEAYVKFKGFRCMGLMPAALPYAIKPLLVGLIPTKLLEILKTRYYQNKQSK